MSNADIKVFHKGEGIQMTFTLRDRPIPPAVIGAPLTDFGNQEIDFVISDQSSNLAVAEFSTTGANITVNDGPNGVWDVNLTVVGLAAVDAEKEYTYDIWSTRLTDEPIHQRNGTFMLLPATPPTP